MFVCVCVCVLRRSNAPTVLLFRLIFSVCFCNCKILLDRRLKLLNGYLFEFLITFLMDVIHLDSFFGTIFASYSTVAFGQAFGQLDSHACPDSAINGQVIEAALR